MAKRKIGLNRPEEEILWDYVSGNLPEQAHNDQERAHFDDPFWNDAVEGLEQTKDKEALRRIQVELQKQVTQRTGKRRKKKNVVFLQIAILGIIVILLLAFLAYFLLHLAAKS